MTGEDHPAVAARVRKGDAGRAGAGVPHLAELLVALVGNPAGEVAAIDHDNPAARGREGEAWTPDGPIWHIFSWASSGMLRLK
jgi:hypothetical protein